MLGWGCCCSWGGRTAHRPARHRDTAGLGTLPAPVSHTGRSGSGRAPGSAGLALGDPGLLRAMWETCVVRWGGWWAQLTRCCLCCQPGSTGEAVGKADPAREVPESPRSPGGALSRGCQCSVPRPAAECWELGNAETQVMPWQLSPVPMSNVPATPGRLRVFHKRKFLPQDSLPAALPYSLPRRGMACAPRAGCPVATVPQPLSPGHCPPAALPRQVLQDSTAVPRLVYGQANAGATGSNLFIFFKKLHMQILMQARWAAQRGCGSCRSL